MRSSYCTLSLVKCGIGVSNMSSSYVTENTLHLGHSSLAGCDAVSFATSRRYEGFECPHVQGTRLAM